MRRVTPPTLAINTGAKAVIRVHFPDDGSLGVDVIRLAPRAGAVACDIPANLNRDLPHD